MAKRGQFGAAIAGVAIGKRGQFGAAIAGVAIGDARIVRRSNRRYSNCTEYSATLQADVICRGYVGILLSAQVML